MVTSNGIQSPNKCRRTVGQDINENNNQTTTFPFMDLPPELRNRIYDLALYHEENEGAIAPVYTGMRCRDGLRTIVLGRAVEIRMLGNYVREASQHVNDEEELQTWELLSKRPRAKREKVVKIETFLDGQEDLPKILIAHICNHHCLTQPALTRTCHQVRAESVLVYYNVNRFHMEVFLMEQNFQPLPVDWWRNAGDSNLRFIKSFTVGVDYEWTLPSYHDAHTRESPELRAMNGCVTGLIDLETVPAQENQTMTLGEWQENAKSGKSKIAAQKWAERCDIFESAKAIERDGLHVQAIEDFVKAVSPNGFWWHDKSKMAQAGNVAEGKAAVEKFEERYRCW